MTEAEKYAAQHSVPENMRDLLQQIVEDGYVYQLGPTAGFVKYGAIGVLG